MSPTTTRTASEIGATATSSQRSGGGRRGSGGSRSATGARGSQIHGRHLAGRSTEEIRDMTTAIPWDIDRLWRDT